MSRWTDTDAFIKSVVKSGFGVEFINRVTALLIDTPTIDIVRCEECKYRQKCRKAVEHITHEITSVTIGSKTVDFCSYGEREDE